MSKFNTNMVKLNEVSDHVEAFVDMIKEKADAHPGWGKVFENVFTNTLETTVKYLEDGDTYVFTGDLPAMWLRDSTAQVRPYLVLAKDDPELAAMIKGLVRRQLKMILIDPYANAFNESNNGMGHQKDMTDISGWIWERKYEVDSLAYPLQLAYLYYKNVDDVSIFDDLYVKAVNVILDVWKLEQNHSASNYRFMRNTWRLEDTLKNEGLGSPVGYTGMTWSGFRPSDDACVYHYIVPSNMFAVVVLGYVEEVSEFILKNENLFKKAEYLRKEIEKGIKNHGIIDYEGKSIFAYEVDGLGNALVMDDPNVPSLLSAPYLGYCDFSDPIFQNTYEVILSEANPYYYKGKVASGCGSSHTPVDYIWPIALAMEGLINPDQEVKRSIIDLLVNTDGETKMMHESFHVDDPTQYTRVWFSWANMMFCELVMDYFGLRVKR